MRRFSAILVMMLVAIMAIANDGVYYVAGSFLVPTKETDISVAKEILTITIGKNDLAYVDVYYEFVNNSNATKTVTMAFEADAPYNTEEGGVLKNTGHPYIKAFTVKMNDQLLRYTNGVIAQQCDNGICETKDFTPLDLSQWKGYDELPDSVMECDGELYNLVTKEYTPYAYAYYFTADFKPGKNIVHHTYSYTMSADVEHPYDIPYWLTPATRWANGKIDDFTLRIKSERDDAFYMCDSLFMCTPFSVKGGNGVNYQYKALDDVHYTLAKLSQGATLEWHSKNFCPKGNINIESAAALLRDYRNDMYVRNDFDKVVVDKKGKAVACYIGMEADQLVVAGRGIYTLMKDDYKVVDYSARDGKGRLISSEEGKSAKVYQKPSTKSAVLGVLKREKGKTPASLPCLGYENSHEKDSFNVWYKTKVNGKTGYIQCGSAIWLPIVL